MLLPYVAPTTDWIRLQRRIPVTIVLDELPADGRLLHGGGRAHRGVPEMIRHLGHFAREVRDIAVETVDIACDTLVKFGRELGELGEAPGRTRQGIVAACSVVLATFLALFLEIQSPWWAAISAFMSLSATGGGSLHRGILRVIGTAAGALLGFVMARWLPYDHFAFYLFLGGVTMLGVIAMQVSPHGLAWLFLCITSILVLLGSLNSPLMAASSRLLPHVRGRRSACCRPSSSPTCCRTGIAEPPPTAPGWRHLLGAQWPVVLHGARSAIAVVRRAADLDRARAARAGQRDGHHRRRRDGGSRGRRRRAGHAACRCRAIAAPHHRLPAGRRRGARSAWRWT